MRKVPYRYECLRCLVSIEGHRPATTVSCVPGFSRHRWWRLAQATHFAFHEAAHAVVAAELVGPEAVVRIAMRRDESYVTTMRLRPRSIEAMVSLMAGGHGVGLVGSRGDGGVGDRIAMRRDLIDWLGAGVPERELARTSDRYARFLSAALIIAERDFDRAARQAVDRATRAIARLAEALVARRVLEGDELRAMLPTKSVSAWAHDGRSSVFYPAYRPELWKRVRRAIAGLPCDDPRRLWDGLSTARR